ncbi:MAG: hypothetical protein AB7F99_10045 [Vicinamibacterales bacterium]
MRRPFTRALVVGLGVLTFASAQSAWPHLVFAAGRTGAVRLDGRSFADEQGPFLALGATLFWALWGERHDPDRLDGNLAWLAARGVDYVRLLGMIGGTSWEDREIDPDADDYWTIVDRLMDRLARHGLRAQVTLFAEADAMMPDAARRREFALAWADRARKDPERIILLEVANEHWQNGLADIGELRDLGRRMGNRTDTLIALSAPLDDRICDVYEGSAADIVTIHYSRSSKGWEAVEEPWEWPDENVPCERTLPVRVNNEPIGPQSSVEADDDPSRLVMSYVTTFMAGNAAYVLHAGAGVRGGGAADRALGRAADFDDTPGLDVALEGMSRAREYLPEDLASWTRIEVSDKALPVRGLDRAVREGAAGAVYAVTSGNRFVIAILDARRPISMTVEKLAAIDVYEAISGEHRINRTFPAGETVRVDDAEAFVVTGRLR